MKLKLLCGCPAFAVAVLGTTAAFAEGAGYFEGHGAYDWGFSVNYDPTPTGTDLWSGFLAGGAWRAAANPGPNFSIQIDAWTGAAIFPGGVDGEDWGTAAHLTGRFAGDRAMWGVLGSVGGGWGEDIFGNLGFEAAFNANRWRLYAQAGMVTALTGHAAATGERDIYATVAVNYFVTPNLFLSANVGADRWFQNVGDASSELTWGAKLEFKPERSPVSFFVAYEGYGFYSTYGTTSNYQRGVANVVLAGFRIPFGVDSLQDLQHGVGLADLNPMYGEVINR